MNYTIIYIIWESRVMTLTFFLQFKIILKEDSLQKLSQKCHDSKLEMSKFHSISITNDLFYYFFISKMKSMTAYYKLSRPSC